MDVKFPMRTPCVPSNIGHIIEVARETWVCFMQNCTMGLVLFCSTNLDPVSSAFSRYPINEEIKSVPQNSLQYSAIPHHTDVVSCTCSACLLLAKRKSCKTSSLLVRYRGPPDIVATHYLSFILHFTQHLFITPKILGCTMGHVTRR